MDLLATTILENLCKNEAYSRKVLPFLKEDYFDDTVSKMLFNSIKDFTETHNTLPTKKILSISVNDYKKFTKEEHRQALETILSFNEAESNLDWLVDRTEKFCKQKSLYNAIMDAISIIDGKDKNRTPDALPSILQDALSISFDKNVGHDFYEDANERYEFYHRKEERIPFHLDMFNKITKGGLPKKTLSVIMAAINCVHPDTKVKIRTRRINSLWTELEAPIKDIQNLLIDNEIEIWSPDGWVEVSDFLEMGSYEEYVVTLENEYTLRCSKDHRFETPIGWMTSSELLRFYNKNIFIHILTDTGVWVKTKSVVCTSEIIPIVDITVNHKNHRYYAAGISSHNCGKSLFLCDHAAHVIRSGKNALYITLEMAEERIAERIDCNLFDISLDGLSKMKKADYTSTIEELQRKHHGRLVIKEFPTAGAHVGHFKMLLDELRMKKNFVPDIIYIDYLNICASQRYKTGGSHNSYTIVKAIAEEVRAMAIEYNVPILSATQATRSGQGNSDLEMSDVSESIGLAATLDFMVAMIRSEELDSLGQVLFKQLKSRFNDLNYYRRFVVGIDIAKFKFLNIDQSFQNNVSEVGRTDEDDKPLFDKSQKSRDFSGIKF